jgi:hypothetical protein
MLIPIDPVSADEQWMAAPPPGAKLRKTAVESLENKIAMGGIMLRCGAYGSPAMTLLDLSMSDERP